MPSEHSSDVKFEIGHVLVIDIVGYSKLLINEQSEQIQKLKEIVRGTEQFRLAEAEGKLLRLPTGDGGALVFRNTAEAPVLCALEISKELKRHPELRVRMGIHSGPVNEVTDLNEQANLAGAGINIAQRVMDCGDAGHILLSKRVADDSSLTSPATKSEIRKFRRNSRFSRNTGLERAGPQSQPHCCCLLGSPAPLSLFQRNRQDRHQAFRKRVSRSYPSKIAAKTKRTPTLPTASKMKF